VAQVITGAHGAVYLKREMAETFVFGPESVSEYDRSILGVPHNFLPGDRVILRNPMGILTDPRNVGMGASSPGGSGVFAGGPWRLSPSVYARSGTGPMFDSSAPERPMWAIETDTQIESGNATTDGEFADEFSGEFSADTATDDAFSDQFGPEFTGGGVDYIPGHPLITEWTYYLGRNDLGEIQLYNSWREAMSGLEPVQLWKDFAGTIQIVPDAQDFKLFFDLKSWELNTDPSKADTTALGEAWASAYKTLMSGSGRFDGYYSLPEDDDNGYSGQYLWQLGLCTDQMARATVELEVHRTTYHRYYHTAEILFMGSAIRSPNTVCEVAGDFLTIGPIRYRCGPAVNCNSNR
jgi:hypothetical protein